MPRVLRRLTTPGGPGILDTMALPHKYCLAKVIVPFLLCAAPGWAPAWPAPAPTPARRTGETEGRPLRPIHYPREPPRKPAPPRYTTADHKETSLFCLVALHEGIE